MPKAGVAIASAAIPYGIATLILLYIEQSATDKDYDLDLAKQYKTYFQ